MQVQEQSRTRDLRAALNTVAGSLWYVPGSFALARVLGPDYALRCVLFHNVADTESAFTKGLNGTISRKNFEGTLKFLTRHYTPVGLQAVLDSFDGKPLPPRPVLVTFDDAYVSVAEVAAPLCGEYGVPAVFFVNAVCLDNQHLALDNLVCYVANVFGMDVINSAIRATGGCDNLEVATLTEVFSHFLPSVPLSSRKRFYENLIRMAKVDEQKLAGEAALYLSSRQLRDLATFNFEIGNHTYSHVNCRTLVADEFREEIDQNRTILELVSGKKVRSFSVPYGSSADLTDDLLTHLQESGYEAAFLAEGRANASDRSLLHLDRVSVHADSDAALFSEIEVLPRLRSMRDRFSPAQKLNRPKHDHTPADILSPAWQGADKLGSGVAVPRETPGL